MGQEPETNFAIAVAGEAVGGIGFTTQHDVEPALCGNRILARRRVLGTRYCDRGVIAVTEYAFANFDLCRLYAHVFD